MDALTELFTKQTSRIIERKFHVIADLSESDFINVHLMPLKQLLVQYHADVEFRENRIPFLIVIPHTIVPLSYQLKTIRESIGDTRWEYVIQPEWFENAEGVATPDIPYLLLDVDTGYAMRNTRPKNCVEIFTAEGRFALTIDEGLALITQFPEVLESHWIDLPGSVLIHKMVGQDAMKRGMLSSLPPAFGQATFVATLYYKYYDSLRVHYVYELTETPYSGSASCGRRLAP